LRSPVAPSLALLVSVSLSLGIIARPARADEATDTARTHYETGLELFYAREHAQALIEFQRAHEVKPRPATLFMMAQCEYLLGSLRQARDHYEAYLTESPTGEFVEVAKDRIESINRRPATLVINSVPDLTDVRIVSADPPKPGAAAPPAGLSGQAPNNFSVPRGRWVVSVSKANFLSQTITVQVAVAETKPLFFKLEPIPARLEIETVPANATLYVNGNRARNPYHQDVPPGRFELIAEAPDYQDRTEDLSLGPGDKKLLLGSNAFRLHYVQRSGRPELVFASAMVGALVGAGAVAAGLGANIDKTDVSSLGFAFGGALTGAVAGVLVANNLVPSSIPDNRGLFVIGGMWIGAAEGALSGIVVQQATTPRVADTMGMGQGLGAYRHFDLGSELRGAFLGSLPGLLVGTGTGALLTDHAPTYGRVALIQSAAAGGALVGSLAAVTFRWNPFALQTVVPAVPASKVNGVDVPGSPPQLGDSHSVLNLSLPALIGLNAGLGAGLLGAYLPDQSRYGPSWERIGLIDLAAGAGALAGGIAACVADAACVSGTSNSRTARSHAAAVALLSGGAGLVAGIILTRNVDRAESPPSHGSLPPPTLGLLPVSDGHGGLTPLVTAAGYF
jgi:hypothetical protein